LQFAQHPSVSIRLLSDPDFVGTSIQFAEEQLKLLEQEYSAQQEAIARELIDAGFLDTDYEGSDGEYTGNEDFDDDSDSEEEEEGDVECSATTLATTDNVQSVRERLSSSLAVKCTSDGGAEPFQSTQSDDDESNIDAVSFILDKECPQSPRECGSRFSDDDEEEAPIADHLFLFMDSYIERSVELEEDDDDDMDCVR